MNEELIKHAGNGVQIAISFLDDMDRPMDRGNLRLRMSTLLSRLRRRQIDERSYDLVHECIGEAVHSLGIRRDRVVGALRGTLACLRGAWRFEELALAIGSRAVDGLEVRAEWLGEGWSSPVAPVEWAIIGHSFDLGLLERDLHDLGWWMSPSGWFEQGDVFGALALLRGPAQAARRDIERARDRIERVEACRAQSRISIIGDDWKIRTAILSRDSVPVAGRC